MKSINKTSAAIFQRLIALMGEEGHLKLDNAKGAYMYLAFEKLYSTDFVGRSATVYSMAHYYVLEGDLVPDPDMTFIALNEQPELVYPMTFQNALTYTEALYQDDNKVWKIKTSSQADLASFANTWLKNIKYQQGI
jgi:hypothetical protein